MPESLVYPDADVAGVWELTDPMPVASSGFAPGRVIATDSAGYQGGDDNADAFQPGAMSLPAISTGLETIDLLAWDEVLFVGTYVTSVNVPYPTVDVDGNSFGVEAGMFIEIEVSTQESDANEPGNPATPSGFTQRWSLHNGVAFRPHVTKFWRVADGSESGSVTVTWPTSCRPHGALKVWSGVDASTPYDVVQAVAYSPDISAVDPPVNTSVTAGAVFDVTVARNKPGGGSFTSISQGYTAGPDSGTTEVKGFLDEHRIVPSAGTEDPGVYDDNSDNWTAVTDVLRPATTTDVTLLVVTSVTDDTETTEVDHTGDVALAGSNEVQAIQSNESAGTIELTFDGDTTSPIAFDATAATVEAALEALPSIGSGNVSVTGGPLDEDAVVVEFVGALAETNLALITSLDDVEIFESTAGAAAQPFTLVDSWNIPRAGNAGEPQGHLWALVDPNPYVAGQPVDITVADHDGLRSWASVLAVVQDSVVPSTWPTGTEDNGQGTTGMWGAVTDTSAGQVVLGFLAKALAVGHYSSVVPVPSVPAGYTRHAEGQGDATTLDLFGSVPAGSQDEATLSVPASVWDGTEEWSTWLVNALPGAGTGAGTALWSVLNAETTTEWVEIAYAAGSMFEVVEFDLDALPANAVIVSARLEFAHQSGTRNRIRAVLAAIDGHGGLHLADELEPGWVPEPLGVIQTVAAATVTDLADGTRLAEWNRLGAALISSTREPGLATHRVFWVRAVVNWVEGPLVSNVTGPVSPGDPIGWTYTNGSGLAQSHFQVMVIEGAGQDPDATTVPDDPLTLVDGDVVYDSGRLPGPLVRSLSISDAPLSSGTCTAAVRAWTRLPSGQLTVSEWATDDFDITGSPPAPGAQATAPVFDASTGSVSVELTMPAGVSRAWLSRSGDGGTLWALAGPFDVTPSSTGTVVDYNADLQGEALYRAAFDDGPMTERTAPASLPGTLSTAIDKWLLMSVDDPDLNQAIDVAEHDIRNPRHSITVEQQGRSATATSGRLATRIGLTLWIRDNQERQEIEAVLLSTGKLRLVDIFGRSWFCVLVDEDRDQILRTQPLPSETTGIRDMHRFSFSLIEVL